MANQVTLATLKARALDYADMTDSGFPVVDRLVDYINSSASGIWDILVDSYEDYFLTQTDINLTPPAEGYDLPADFYKCLKVFYKATDNRRFKIRKFDLNDINAALIKPFSGGVVELWYVPQMELLVHDADTIGSRIPPIVKGWEDAIALDAAIKLLIREESDPSALMREKDMLLHRIMQMADPRDDGEPDQVQITGAVANPYDLYFGSGSYSYRYRIMGQQIRFLQYAMGV